MYSNANYLYRHRGRKIQVKALLTQRFLTFRESGAWRSKTPATFYPLKDCPQFPLNFGRFTLPTHGNRWVRSSPYVIYNVFLCKLFICRHRGGKFEVISFMTSSNANYVYISLKYFHLNLTSFWAQCLSFRELWYFNVKVGYCCSIDITWFRERNILGFFHPNSFTEKK